MRLAGTTYSLQERAFDIFLSGCKGPHCTGCHNPAAWDFNYGEPLDDCVLIAKIEDNLPMISKIRIMGGEPMDQPIRQLIDLLHTIVAFFPDKELWLFTGYLPEDLSPAQEKVYEYVDYMKFGRYNSTFPPVTDPLTGVRLGSGNQYIWRSPYPLSFHHK